MTVNSLSNFGVVGLAGERSPALAPIFSNRFRTLFYNFGAVFEPAPYDLTRQCFSISRPNITFEPISLYNYISTVYVVNRGEWQEMTLRFYDDITNSVMRRIMNQIAKQQNFFDQTVSRAGENYKFEIDLDVLAGGGSAGGGIDPNILQKWCYAGCMIVGDNLGEFNHKENSNMEIEITVKFDNCIGFDQNGRMMGTFSHSPEILGQQGVHSTGAGVAGGESGVSLLNVASSSIAAIAQAAF